MQQFQQGERQWRTHGLRKSVHEHVAEQRQRRGRLPRRQERQSQSRSPNSGPALGWPASLSDEDDGHRCKRILSGVAAMAGRGDLIRERAYQIWQDRGQPENVPDDHWHSAEHELAEVEEAEKGKKERSGEAAKQQ
jgi:hypothetical protein